MTRNTGRLALMTEPGQLTMAEYNVPEPERDAVALRSSGPTCVVPNCTSGTAITR